MMIAELNRSNEIVVKYLREYEQVEVRLSHDEKKAKDFKGMTFEQIEEKFIPVWEKMQDFMPMNSKLESERLKRPGIQLDIERIKKLKTAEALGIEPTQKQQSEEPKELSEEEIKKMIELVPVEELYIKALQGTSDFYASGEDYPLTKGLTTLMLSNKLQVDQYSEMANELLMKIYIYIYYSRQSKITRCLEESSPEYILAVRINVPTADVYIAKKFATAKDFALLHEDKIYSESKTHGMLETETDASYHKEKMLLCKQEEAGIQLNEEQANWKDDTDDESKDQELEAHYMYITQIQEVTQDTADNSGPIFDVEPLQKVQNDDDNYNVFDDDQDDTDELA
nr:hypothetical protein [Tanacetum cinerariifolium]